MADLTYNDMQRAVQDGVRNVHNDVQRVVNDVNTISNQVQGNDAVQRALQDVQQSVQNIQSQIENISQAVNDQNTITQINTVQADTQELKMRLTSIEQSLQIVVQHIASSENG